jgi:hypothetical protein
MAFIEGEAIHNKRMNLIVYEKPPIDFIYTESSWKLVNVSSFTIREGIDRLRKARIDFIGRES